MVEEKLIWKEICPTLRSWLHETSALIMTLSPGLEKNYTSERSSNSFPGTTCMSGCLENCQKSIPKSWGSPIQGTISNFFVKLQDRFVPLFLHILGPFLLDWRTSGLWNVFLTVFQAPWHTCHSWKTLGTSLQCVVLLQSRGQCHD